MFGVNKDVEISFNEKKNGYYNLKIISAFSILKIRFLEVFKVVFKIQESPHKLFPNHLVGTKMFFKMSPGQNSWDIFKTKSPPLEDKKK